MDKTFTTLDLHLDPPLEAKGGGRIALLTLREPTGSEAMVAERHLNSSGPEYVRAYQLQLISAVAGVDVKALDELPVGKQREAFAFLSAFLDRGLEAPAIDLLEAGETDFALDEPITALGATYTGLRLREPTSGQVRKAEAQLRSGATPANVRGYQMWLIANVTEAPFAVVSKMPVSKINEAAMYLQGFIAGGPATGPS